MYIFLRKQPKVQFLKAWYTEHLNLLRIELPKCYGAQPIGELDQSWLRSGEQTKCLHFENLL